MQLYHSGDLHCETSETTNFFWYRDDQSTFGVLLDIPTYQLDPGMRFVGEAQLRRLSLLLRVRKILWPPEDISNCALGFKQIAEP